MPALAPVDEQTGLATIEQDLDRISIAWRIINMMAHVDGFFHAHVAGYETRLLTTKLIRSGIEPIHVIQFRCLLLFFPACPEAQAAAEWSATNR